MTPVPLVLVAAVAKNGVIGGDNSLLWKLRSDMRHFRGLTMGRPLIMGRKTFESIGKPLPGRETIVVSRRAGGLPEGVHLAHSLEEALSLGQARARALQAPSVVVAGGGEIYKALIDQCDRLELTEVELQPAGDAHFPAIDPARWREVRRERHEPGEGDEAAFTFVAYDRQHGSNLVEKPDPNA